ncbi:dynamin-binding protein-like isoform X2 [Babylonia areolata]|uniref:dynamin-binding protein-like isoform X2 n=1 Tax=Babylonia areolata TaxID=304850 RepID=UPI003FD4BB22
MSAVGHYVKAVYDFAAQQSGELSLQAGDIVKVTDNTDGSWLQGEAVCGVKGSFPANFVEPLVLPDARMGQRVFVAVVDFPSDQSGDLELTKGDIILGTEQVDDNWWKGKNGPLRGIFPLSCVHELDIVTEGSHSRSASLRCRSASLKSRADSLARTSEVMFARALVDVIPQIEGELGFQAGDLITVTEVVDDDWFYGQCHNKVGLVSTICVEFLEDFADDSEVGAGHLSSENSKDNRNTKTERESEQVIREEYRAEDVADRITSLTSDFTCQSRVIPQNTVSYTRENTRSHDAEITPYAKTLFPFQAQLPTELSFGENEIVTLIQHVDEEWIEGDLDGKTGLFPATFVEIIVDCPYAYDINKISQTHSLDDTTETQNLTEHGHNLKKELHNTATTEVKDNGKEQTVSQNGHNIGLLNSSDVSDSSREKTVTPDCQQTTDDISFTGFALVLHDFLGEIQGDLNVKEGDTIEVLRMIDFDWLEARKDGGTVGLVPQNHVQVISGAPQGNTTPSSRLSEGTVTTGSSASGYVAQISGIGEKEAEGVLLAGSRDGGISNTSVLCPPSPDSESSQITSRQTSHPSSQTPVSSASSTKPSALKPKPKLAPKPIIKPKPKSSLVSKSVVSAHGTCKEPVTGQRSYTEKSTFKDHDDDGQNVLTGESKKVFSGLDVTLSLDNLVKVEIEKAKSEVDESRGNSVVGEGKKSRSDSFSSTVSGEHNVSTVASDSQHTEDSDKRHSQKIGDTLSVVTEKETSDAVLRKKEKSSLRPKSNTDVEHLTLSSPIFNRSNNDNSFSAVKQDHEVSLQTAVSVSPKASPSYSMSPHRPAILKAEDKGSFVNAGFEHDNEGQLISLEATSRPPHPTRSVPRPPVCVQFTNNGRSQDVSSHYMERRIKRPPPRPTGPRIAPVPSKTPLQPVSADGSKPIPHRPAPAAPGSCHSVPVNPSSSSSTTPPPPSTTAIPPRPLGMAGMTPPKRPPPRLQKSASDLMRFSPEPVEDEGEDKEELVTDLKNRLQENRNDIQKYEQSKQELEKKLAEAEESEKLETEESLQFVLETLHGLKEEEKRLKGNLFSVSPREEKLEKARLLAEQRAADECLRREEEQKNAAEERSKRREKRQKVLQELVETEKDYLFDLQLCLTTFFDSDSAIRVPSSVDIEFLFGNMEEIADVAQRLLTSLESAISGKAFHDQIVGSTFVALADDMKNTYAPYCRHHDDVIAVMEKHREVPEACQYFAAKVEEMRRRTNIFDVEAMLIKPVQRILKYPLLLHELLKSTEDDHPDKVAINSAIRAMTDVATAINEYKRRKDLVFKYKRDSDQSFAMKIAKLNFHSIKKKSSRMRGRLSTNLGIGLQLRDENFEREETHFRSAEKAVKMLLRNVMSYMDQMQDVIVCQENLAADISDYFGDKACEEVTRYLTVHRELLSHYKTLTCTVEELVLCPLNKLVAMMNGPNNVIDKRFDKLLDYNNLLGRGKDEKLVQAAKKDYEAMNAQLLDELPKLYQLIISLLKHCMAAYVRAQRDFQDHALKENCILLELPSVLGGSENVMENFNIRHTAALDQISMLSFIPRGFNPKMDAFRLDRRGSSRQLFDPSKPPPTIQSSSQSDSQRMYLRQMYGADNLYQVTHTMPAHDLMDMAVTVGTLVAVIKDKDPMGGRQRWFVDDGANKGFVQSSILTKPSRSPTGSLSSLTAEDSDDLASICSTSMDEGDTLPWLSSQSTPVYPQVTKVSQEETSMSASAQPVYEYYCAEYPFQGRSSNEVSLVAGQVVVVISYQDLDGNTEWWLVDADGDQGYVPANYLRKL